LEQWDRDNRPQQAEREQMFTPQAVVDKPPRCQHQKRQGREFNKCETEGVALGGATEGKRKGQKDKRR
jgi:hypothetical protein